MTTRLLNPKICYTTVGHALTSLRSIQWRYKNCIQYSCEDVRKTTTVRLYRSTKNHDTRLNEDQAVRKPYLRHIDEGSISCVHYELTIEPEPTLRCARYAQGTICCSSCSTLVYYGKRLYSIPIEMNLNFSIILVRLIFRLLPTRELSR